MRNSGLYSVILFATVGTYFTASKQIFDKVYTTSDIVIDELFHLPQGLQYCKGNFTYWDPKITTLPGLYLISSIFLGSYFECDTYNLRFINLIASVVNYLLFSSIVNFVYPYSPLKTVLQALNLALLPPLYFFSHVYYTDTLSLMFFLAFSRLCFTNTYKFAILLLGLMSVLMRQTNIIWILLVLGHKTFDILIKSSRVFGNKYLSNITLRDGSRISKDVNKSKLKRYYGFSDLLIALKYHISTCFTTFFKYLTLQDWLILLVHTLLLVSFAVFVFINGSIVVGDKSAHQATIHIPQLFYFLIFYGVFGMPYVFNKLKATFGIIFSNKFKVFLLTVLCLAVVHYNTVVHPYLLADNRHYTFYIWNRWYGKYEFAKYVSVPAYIFLLVNLYANLRDQNCISFLFPYSICLFLALCLQKMIEVRYFLIPYIILRVRFQRPSLPLVLVEFLWYIALNMVTFFIFFNKEFVWQNFDAPQRIIW